MSESTISTGAGLDDVANVIGGLSIADHTEVGNGTNLAQPTLTKAILGLNQTARAAFLQGQQVLASGSDTLITTSGAMAEISSLYRKVDTLVEAANAMRHATERSIIKRIILLGGQMGPHTKELLKYFDKEIMWNVQYVLDSSGDEACVLWKIAEKCYKSAINPSSRLQPDDYFRRLDEAWLEWPYDSNLESEEYHEHKKRLDVDEDYAELWSRDLEVRKARKIKEREEKRQGWIDFWVRVLNNCPGGPTLFYSPAASSAARSIEEPPFEDDPRYLFRAFDWKSSGKNDDKIVASTMSMSGNTERSKIDILSLNTHEASEMLYNHLVKGCFDGSASDNLMSWSSSLMYVIQYAIWRSHIGNLSPAEVRICVIDRVDFPYEQFVPDMLLLKAFDNTELSEDQNRFFRFRLGNLEYDNGEYLSQGVVNHGGRSHTFSLQDLVDAGLYELYPEFGDVRFRGLCSERVRDLRFAWDTEQKTTRQEILHAFNIAVKCSRTFSELDIAMLLLTFKNRKLHPTKFQYDLPRVDTSGPAEVRRYVEARRLELGDGNTSQFDSEYCQQLIHRCNIEAAQSIFGCLRVNNESKGGNHSDSTVG